MLLEVDPPDRLTLLGRGQVEEERAQRKAPAQLRRQARDGIGSRNKKHSSLGYRVDDLEGRAQPFGRSAKERALHAREIKVNRGDARRAPRGLCCRTLGAPRWPKKYRTVGFSILHISQDRTGHLRLHAGEVGTRSRKCLLDLINENDD